MRMQKKKRRDVVQKATPRSNPDAIVLAIYIILYLYAVISSNIVLQNGAFWRFGLDHKGNDKNIEILSNSLKNNGFFNPICHVSAYMMYDISTPNGGHKKSKALFWLALGTALNGPDKNQSFQPCFLVLGPKAIIS